MGIKMGIILPCIMHTKTRIHIIHGKMQVVGLLFIYWTNELMNASW